jgi:hypothetical protein
MPLPRSRVSPGLNNGYCELRACCLSSFVTGTDIAANGGDEAW